MNRNIEFILTKFNLGMLENREYKINTIMVLLFDSTIIVILFLFLQILEQTSSITGWNPLSYLLFILYVLFTSKFYFALTFRNFNRMLLNGELNLYLNRPISPFLFLLTKNMNGANSLTLLALVFPITLYISIFFSNTTFSWIIVFLGIIQSLLLFWILEFTSFFFKNNEFLSRPIKRMNYFFEEYVPLFFKNTSFFSLLGLIPSVIFGFLAVEVARGSFQYLYLLYYAIPTIPIFSLISYILYKKGIEKYEAFG